MSYYEPADQTIVLTSEWHLHCTSRRYFAAALKEVLDKLKPERDCIWKGHHKSKLNGYQATLVAFSTCLGDNELSYPDW